MTAPASSPPELRETFHIEQPIATVWARLRLDDAPPTAGAPCRIPGFPSNDADNGAAGCLVEVVRAVPQRSLRTTKVDQPCQGSSIAIDIGPANASGWPTRVSVAQTNLPPFMAAMPDAVRTHWRQIVADFRLYLEREALAPPTAWGPDFGAQVQQTPIGLELTAVAADGYAARCGMRQGDLLLALRGIRIHDLAQLWTVLALTKGGDRAEAAWVREGVQTGVATLALNRSAG